jgi:hypothetical protein
METFASFLRKIANNTFWQDKIQEKYSIVCAPKETGGSLDPIILRQTYLILSRMPVKLVKDCGVTQLLFSSTMGPNKSYYPNHGYFYPGDKSVTMNVNVYYHPDIMDDFFDHHGYFVNRIFQTLVHEMFHGYDAVHNDLSLKPEWLKLSGWSPVPRLGLKRMVINEPGMPAKIGEWYYDPSAEFTRFYARMNPWDDWADSACYKVSGLDKLPANKNAYFDKLLKKYY